MHHWQTAEWHPGHHGAFENARRLAAMQTAPGSLDLGLAPLTHSQQGDATAFAADPAQGRLIAQGYEAKAARRHIGYWLIDRNNRAVPGGQEFSLERLDEFVAEHEREVSNKKGRKATQA